MKKGNVGKRNIRQVNIQRSHDDEILSQMQDYYKQFDSVKKEKNETLYSLLKIFIGIVLLSLIFVYSDAISSALFVFSGHQQSVEIDSNYTMIYNDYTVFFAPDVYKKILAIHQSANGNEIKVCLLGTIENKKYTISALYVPEIAYQSGINVVSEMCDENTIISFHSHPIESCLFSKADIESYAEFKKVNPEGMIGMMCTQKRFAFYWE